MRSATSGLSMIWAKNTCNYRFHVTHPTAAGGLAARLLPSGMTNFKVRRLRAITQSAARGNPLTFPQTKW